MILIEDIFEAYYDCRKHKRNTLNALAFEVNFEEKLIELCREINERTYTIGKSIAFVVTRPKYREVFAADFRDRIVHHLVMRKLEPYFEKDFIEDTYNCRSGKGNLYGIRRIQEQVRSATNNYTEDKFIFKGDISGFFMHISRELLWRKVRDFIIGNYNEADKEDILWLTEMIIMHCPEKNCHRKGNIALWDNLPKEKSLFTCGEDLGLPIGNLSSQILANFFLTEFDKWMKSTFDGYGRYVDDFIVIGDKPKILALLPKIRQRLAELRLTLHKKKFYLQHFSKGVSFIGAIIKFDRLYPGKACVHNFKEKLLAMNRVEDKERFIDKFLSSMNSYLGFMKPYLSYAIKRAIIKVTDGEWWRYCYITGPVRKLCKRKYLKYNLV